MTFRFIHTADWQIGKPFDSLGAEVAPLLREARLAAIDRLAALARDEQIAHVLVAGEGAAAGAAAAAKIPGVTKVLTGPEAPVLAEPLAALLVSLAPGYSHLLAPASAAVTGRSASVIWTRRPQPVASSTSQTASRPASAMPAASSA